MSAPSPPAVPGTATTVRTSPHTTKVRVSHPLDPLTPDEILLVTSTLRRHVATQTDIKAIKFIVCSLLPPPKRVVLAALGIPITPGAKPEEPIEIVRKAEMDFIDLVSGVSFNAIVVLKGTEWTVGSIDKLDVGLQPQISVEELTECEQIVRDDKRVQELALAVGVQPHQIYADGWAIGYDDRFPESKRIQQALCFARFSEHDNLYAHPLDFVPVIDSNKHCVIHIDFPPSYSKSNDESAHTLSTSTTAPPALDADPSTASNRDRIPPPRQAFDFLPDLMKETEEGYAPRTSLKPLHIVQPEGVSFKMDGHELEWENWKMHVAFSHREGIALSTVTYDDHGEVRPIFYRLSLAEMVVPYGAPVDALVDNSGVPLNMIQNDPWFGQGTRGGRSGRSGQRSGGGNPGWEGLV